jgi:hypothetical protein
MQSSDEFSQSDQDQFSEQVFGQSQSGHTPRNSRPNENPWQVVEWGSDENFDWNNLPNAPIQSFNPWSI